MNDDHKQDIPNEGEGAPDMSAENTNDVPADMGATAGDSSQGDDAQGSNDTSAGTDPIAALEAQVQEFKEIAARAQADAMNAKKRMEREKQEFINFANTNCITAMLPVLDNLDRALRFLPEDQKESDLGKGVQSVCDQFVKVFEGLGVKRIPAIEGSSYDPTFHEAVMQGEGKKDAILEIMEHGYELNGRVLRPTKVKVGKGEE